MYIVKKYFYLGDKSYVPGDEIYDVDAIDDKIWVWLTQNKAIETINDVVAISLEDELEETEEVIGDELPEIAAEVKEEEIDEEPIIEPKKITRKGSKK